MSVYVPRQVAEARKTSSLLHPTIIAKQRSILTSDRYSIVSSFGGSNEGNTQQISHENVISASASVAPSAAVSTATNASASVATSVSASVVTPVTLAPSVVTTAVRKYRGIRQKPPPGLSKAPISRHCLDGKPLLAPDESICDGSGSKDIAESTAGCVVGSVINSLERSSRDFNSVDSGHSYFSRDLTRDPTRDLTRYPRCSSYTSRGRSGPRPRTKLSIGIACCRIDDVPRILLVQKRFTYAYSAFVHGKYAPGKNSELIALFNMMTVDEKIVILSMSFPHIWYRIWLGYRHHESYEMASRRFKELICDGGVRMRRLIASSKNNTLIWEIPKGRKKNRDEPDILCAMREFEEETGIVKSQYRVISEPRTQQHTDENVNYVSIYYTAIATCDIAPVVSFKIKTQIDEINDCRWFSLSELKVLDPTGRLERICKPSLRYVVRKTRLVRG